MLDEIIEKGTLFHQLFSAFTLQFISLRTSIFFYKISLHLSTALFLLFFSVKFCPNLSDFYLFSAIFICYILFLHFNLWKPTKKIRKLIQKPPIHDTNVPMFCGAAYRWQVTRLLAKVLEGGVAWVLLVCINFIVYDLIYTSL